MSITTTGPATSRSAAYQVLERIFDEGFATGNDAIVDEICSPDLVEHQFGAAGRTGTRPRGTLRWAPRPGAVTTATPGCARWG